MAASVRSRIQQGFVLGCVVLGLVSTAWGSPVWVQVTGEVTQSDFATIAVGSPVTGFYTYDDHAGTLPDPDPYSPDGNPVWYEAVSVGLTFVDASSIQTDLVAIMVNDNSGGSGTVDEYAIDFSVVPGGGTWTGAFVGPDWTTLRGSIVRHDLDGDAWDGVALPDPETVLGLLSKDSSWVEFYNYNAADYTNRYQYIHLLVTDLSVVPAPVPVPGALALGAIGAGCCRWLFRRKTV